MGGPSSLRRFLMLLPLLIVAAYLMAPVNKVQAQGCIEYTVWNEQTRRCECPDQWCCDFYYPFIPYGCEMGEATAEKLPISATLFHLLQYEPQVESNGAEFGRLEFLPIAKQEN